MNSMFTQNNLSFLSVQFPNSAPRKVESKEKAAVLQSRGDGYQVLGLLRQLEFVEKNTEMKGAVQKS